MDTNEKLHRLDDQPEPLAALQARWPAALAKLWLIDDPEYNVDRGPGKYREHVFDCENGFRLIASREKYSLVNGGVPHLHVSASFRAGSPVEQIVAGQKSPSKRRATFYRLVRGAFAEISGLLLPEKPVYVTAAGIPHYALRDPVEEQKTS